MHALVEDDFQSVNTLVLNTLHSKASIINDLGRYIIQAGGKRLRPLLVLLTARACGYKGTQHIPLAAIVECIHTATLLHDDVVDEATLRRGQKTANHVWGNQAAVLVGDFLYSKAFQMLMQIENAKIMPVLATATNVMAEGEALQLQQRHRVETEEGDYFNIIQAKTAKLFEASTEMTALLANVNGSLVKSLAQFGWHLGTAFQLIDDILDYDVSVETGKKLGNDLMEGKMTLPLIYLREKASPQEAAFLETAIRSPHVDHLPRIQQLIKDTGALDYTRHLAHLEAKKAEKALVELPTSPYKEALQKLIFFAIDRDH